MQLTLSDYAAESIAQAACDLQLRLLSEAQAEYSIADLQQVLLACLDSLVDDWAADCFEHCTRPAPYGWSQSEFDRRLRSLKSTR